MEDFKTIQILIKKTKEPIIKELLAKLKDYDEYTYLHSISVAKLCVSMALCQKFSKKEVDIMATSALLHDIGKIFVPKSILNKVTHLTDDEFVAIRKHPTTGAKYLDSIGLFEPIVIETICQHHENFDGSGYPKHLKGDEVNKYAKILRVMDSYDAMISNRPYHHSRNSKEVITILVSSAGKEYDSDVVNQLL